MYVIETSVHCEKTLMTIVNILTKYNTAEKENPFRWRECAPGNNR